MRATGRAARHPKISNQSIRAAVHRGCRRSGFTANPRTDKCSFIELKVFVHYCSPSVHQRRQYLVKRMLPKFRRKSMIWYALAGARSCTGRSCGTCRRPGCYRRRPRRGGWSAGCSRKTRPFKESLDWEGRERRLPAITPRTCQGLCSVVSTSTGFEIYIFTYY